jgi:hypothetical protein
MKHPKITAVQAVTALTEGWIVVNTSSEEMYFLDDTGVILVTGADGTYQKAVSLPLIDSYRKIINVKDENNG